MLEHDIGVLLKEQGLTLATAESCTGGLVGHRITNVPGSSAYYLGGVVAYAYEAKEMLLDVCHETLLAFGAVSEETAREMARGARLRLNADLGLSVTGIAGPAGGTPTKPVGLVYIALVTPDGEWCHRHVCQGNRRTNKAHFAQAALQAVEAYLAGRQVKGHNSERGAKDGVH